MFLENKYTSLYYKLVEKALTQNRVKSEKEYFELHHIIPKSLGGTEKKTNKILFTAREHFLAHWLLTKMFDDATTIKKMKFALHKMYSNNKYQERHFGKWQFGLIRETARELSIGDKNNFFGRKHSEESKRKISAGNKGKVLSEETKALISKNHARTGSTKKGFVWISSIREQRSQLVKKDQTPKGWGIGRIF